jgi:conjugal transfer pilin signal peptidase TrbI
LAKPFAFDHRSLEPIAEGVIPADHYYVQGTGVDSFDSRYRISGLVAGAQVLAKVRPLF